MSILTKAALLLALAASLISCKKDDEDEPIAPPDPNAAYSIADFSLLTEGNYWVYERRTYDSAGVLMSGPILDSVFLEGDTMLNGDTYRIQRRLVPGVPSPGEVRCLRDVGNRILDDHGSVIFQYGVFGQVVWTYSLPWLYIDYSLSSNTSQQVVPAGSFTCYKWQGSVVVSDENMPSVPAHRQPYYNWSPGVGKVRQMEPYISSGWTVVHELLRYHVH